jgi:SAM-dependent methyltransferase
VLSLRDPEGFVFERDGAILRFVRPSAVPRIRRLLGSRSFARLRDDGRIVDSKLAGVAPEAIGQHDGAVIEHQRISFPSYPSEWHPEMLADAARATLDVAQTIADDGFTLKDATPFNVLFDGARPVLVDLLSIEDRPATYPYWLAEAQYLRTFALPLFAASRGLTLRQIFLSSREGLEPRAVLPLARMRDRFRRSFWLNVRLPLMAEPAQGQGGATLQKAYRKEVAMDAAMAGFIYGRTLTRHHSMLAGLAGRVRTRSAWSGYTANRQHYDVAALHAKRDAVRKMLEEVRGGDVLDVGANTGEFSEMAAENNAVVALDSDLDSVGEIYRSAKMKGLDILPLHVNVASPTPGTGWQNRETRSFEDRARGFFDCVLMLAVIHHLRITEGIPLPALVDQVAELTRDRLIIEHVAPEDPMSEVLARGRQFLTEDLKRERFEAALVRRFTVEARQDLNAGTRALYMCRKKI